MTTRHRTPDAASGYPHIVGRQPRPDRAPQQEWTALGDDLFRIVHDDGFTSGRLRVAEATAAMGLAGALLAELVWCGRIDLLDDGLVVVADPTAPPDAAAHTVLAEIANEPTEHPISTWVRYVAGTSYQLVAKRMVHRGQVREEVSRRWGRSATTYMPVSVKAAAWPAARLNLGYGAGRLSAFDCVLTGLVCAVGLAHHVFYEASEQNIAALPTLVHAVAAPLPDLVRQVHATVGQAVMTAR